jgi:hypothetical protein
VLGATKPFQPETTSRVVPRVSGGTPLWSFRELLPDVARTYGVHFISDAYWEVGWYVDPKSVASAEPKALFALLDRLARPGHRWDRVGELIRVRSRTWFLDRPREIPLRLVRRWKARFDRNGGLSLDEFVEIARGLTETQLLSLDSVRRDTGLEDLDAAWKARYTLQLYGALSPAQRELVWRGSVLLAAQMTPLQRELFAASLNDARVARVAPSFRVAQQRSRPMRIPWAQLATGTLSLTTQPLLRTIVKRGGAVLRQTTEPVPPAGTPGVGSAPAAPNPGVPGGAPGPPSEEVRRWPLMEVSFHFRYGSQTEDTVRLTVAPAVR